MERFTAYLELTPYSWLTLLSITLGGVAALLTIRADRRRYPALFRRRRLLAILFLLLVSALSIPAAMFLPGPSLFPSVRSLLLFVLPLTLLCAGGLRFPKLIAPPVLLLLGVLIWSEAESTGSYLFPNWGEPIAIFEVREAGEESLDLFAEFPPAARRRLLEDEAEYSFPLALNAASLAIEGELVAAHAYLWWRAPSVGVRITGIEGSTGGSELFDSLSGRSERSLRIFERLSLLRRSSWRASVPSEDLLLARYELTLEEGSPVLVRRVNQSD
ncbi:MAG: hypothetical protein ACLFPW_13020 [Spirochaetaceae bacterium]